MPFRLTLLTRISATTVISLLLSACAGSGRLPPPSEQRSCPTDEVVVCWGGTTNKTGRIRDREPRMCECRPRDRITFLAAEQTAGSASHDQINANAERGPTFSPHKKKAPINEAFFVFA